VNLFKDYNISRFGFIKFSGDRSLLMIYNNYENSIQKFGSIIVERGSVSMSFVNSLPSHFFIDDFLVNDDSRISIYKDYGPRIFVKKTSIHLKDSLTRIQFWGHSESVGVRDYDEDYWEIGVGAGFGGIPEPVTYGATFSLFGLGFVAWRRRVRRARGAVSLSKRR